MDRRRKGAGSVEVKDGSWSVRYLCPKRLKRTRRALGRASDMTEEEAQRAADDFIFTLRGNVPGASLTVAQLAELYRPVALGHLAESTVEMRAGIYRVAARHFGGRPVGSIDRAAAQDYVAYCRIGRHGNTVGLHVGCLGLLWEFAEERHLVLSNPWRTVKVPKYVERPIPQVDVHDVERVASFMPSELERLLVLFLDATGLRFGEAKWLRAEHVRGGRMLVKSSKTGRVRKFEIPEEAVPLLKRIRMACGRHERLFDGLPEHATVLRHLHKACELADVPQLRLHDLRHHFGDDLAAGGTQQADIAAVMGHANLRTTERYTRNHPDAAADRAVGRLNAHRAALRKRRKAE
ncbi:MAG TPA: tyrosine-type recombinase/integrase [Planctomycetota bacterium]|nr:tyrosine-type recombinase/integrase [Planctomycetota bacterium]